MMWVLWPSFVVAGLADGLIFTLVNPADLVFFDQPVDFPKEGIYTMGFFVMWFFCALSSAITLFIIPDSWRMNITDSTSSKIIAK
jgi:hypothetical protein